MLLLTWVAAGTAFFPANIPSWTSRRRRTRLEVGVGEEIVWLALSWTMIREKLQDSREPNALNLEGGVLALGPPGTGESTAGRSSHVTSATLFPESL